jgi:hypothetical protein
MILGGKSSAFAEPAREKTSADRTPRHEADAQLLDDRQDLFLRTALEE